MVKKPHAEEPAGEETTQEGSLPAISQGEQGEVTTTAAAVADEYLLPNDFDWPWVWAIRDGTYLDWGRHIRQFDPELTFKILCSHTTMPVEIIPKKLYLADADGIHNVPRMQQLKITGVLNMAASHKYFRKTETILKKQGISYQGIAAEDSPEYPLLHLHMEEAFAAIDTMTQDGGRCVVNCVMGKNRSVLVVASYYMLHQQVPVLDTLKHIRLQRGNCALVNEGFQEQLVALARRHKLLGGRPGTQDNSFVREMAPPRTQKWRTTRANIQRAVTPAKEQQRPLWKRHSLFKNPFSSSSS